MTNLEKAIERTLVDASLMIKEELRYVATGKHPGVPMRNCQGQWASLQRDIEARLKELRS